MLNSSSILTTTLLAPFIGGLTILLLPPRHAKKSRPLAILFAIVTLVLSILIASCLNWNRITFPSGDSSVQLSLRLDLIRSLGAQYFVGVDGISVPLILLTTAISLLAIWASYGINKSIKAYYALMLFLLAGMIGTFIALDLLLFFFFFEISILPMLLLIGIWGGSKSLFAVAKFFIYALLGSIGIGIAILGVYRHTLGLGADGAAIFDVVRLATDPLIRIKFSYGGDAFHFGQMAFWLLLAGFGIRSAAVPLHTWLSDAHAEAPTPVSMILSAILLPMGAYGLLRIAYPLFPQQAADAWYYVAAIGVLAIIYAAFVAMAQRDFKRLVAYFSISQMGYVLLGIAVMNPIGTEGALFQQIAHGISSAMMFFVVGILSDRAHHREIPRLGGIWSHMPAYTGWAAVGFFASIGLPGLCGFIGQLLVILGTFSAGDPNSLLMRHTNSAAFVPLLWYGCLSAAATILTAGYMLWTLQRVYMGAPKPEHQNFPGLTASEKWILATLGLGAFILGIAPAILLEHIRPAIDGMMKLVSG